MEQKFVGAELNAKERNIRLAFLVCYLYFAIAIPMSLMDMRPVGTVEKALDVAIGAVILALIVGLFIMMTMRLIRSSHSKSTKLFWSVVFFLTNFFGATAFYIFETFQEQE